MGIFQILAIGKNSLGLLASFLPRNPIFGDHILSSTPHLIEHGAAIALG